jgi:penicillin-binding protein 1A
MNGLQAVVDYEWSHRPTSYAPLAMNTEEYLKQTDYDPFAYFWSSRRDTVASFIRESRSYHNLLEDGLTQEAAMDSLINDQAFMADLKQAKTRLEAGMVSIDPRNGQVKAWVGGRDLKTDWSDKVASSRRQPGSTFKPFVYIAAIDNGFSPQYTLPDCTFTHIDELGREWTPRNSEGVTTGRMLTLRDGLKDSKNTITGRLMLQILPPNVAFYARRMGIESPLNEVMSLALGTSNVTLLEMTSAYSTLANGGLHYAPTVVTRIEDRSGNVLFEAEPTPEEALSEETAYTVIDMMRDVIDNGTAVRLRGQFGLYG